MENKEFQIIPLQERCLLVVILSSEMTSHYWKELQAQLANCNIADAEVYFDFLYRFFPLRTRAYRLWLEVRARLERKKNA